ncbi:MAG TPA: hypothetical protein VG099_24685 [Gemmataceae bacterium]|jgi:hypothetical protein|nr:hypothetical protein [Gemmataceae bacterium]
MERGRAGAQQLAEAPEARREADDSREDILSLLKEIKEDIQELRAAIDKDDTQAAPGIDKHGKFTPGGPQPLANRSAPQKGTRAKESGSGIGAAVIRGAASLFGG